MNDIYLHQGAKVMELKMEFVNVEEFIKVLGTLLLVF